MARRMPEASIPTLSEASESVLRSGSAMVEMSVPFSESSVFIRLISPCRGRAGRHYFNPRQDMTSKRNQKQDMTFLIKQAQKKFMVSIEIFSSLC